MYWQNDDFLALKFNTMVSFPNVLKFSKNRSTTVMVKEAALIQDLMNYCEEVDPEGLL